MVWRWMLYVRVCVFSVLHMKKERKKKFAYGANLVELALDR